MFYLIVGATCAGKDRIATYLTSAYGIKPIVSTTSRPIRPKEKEGVEYFFLDREEFLKRANNGEFIEYRSYETTVKGIKDTWYYGVEKKNVSNTDNDYVAVISLQGTKRFIEEFGKENVTLIYVKSSYAQRYVRNILRGDFDLSEWLRRNKEDEAWLTEAAETADYIVENLGWEEPENPMDKKLIVDLNESDKDKFKQTEKELAYIINKTRNIIK